MKRVTIYDVAKEAGVSLATVSRVINDSTVVKSATKQKVEDAIMRLGYKPNAIAQGLALQKTTMIGLIVPDTSFSYTGQIINGLLDVSKIYNYSVVLHTITEGISDVDKIIDVIIKSRVDGVIICSDKIRSEEINLLSDYNIPIVVIGNKISASRICSVYVDFENAIYELTNSYLKKGKKDIVILEDRKNRSTSKQLVSGAEKAFAENGLTFNGFVPIPKEERSSYRFLSHYFKDHKHELVIVNRDSQAFAALNAARENGISVPEEMELVCVIDTKYNSMVRPMISAYTIPSYDLGAVGMRLMTKMLENGSVEDKEKCLTYLFVERQTTLKD
ncbi:MAG: LacI family DNA-binding transcriptional regulator [Erysipelotrichaceae bacterium]|nr:LacI family DNA-binding transcriptional regulator [Erysipelotrichaceae bacterium]